VERDRYEIGEVVGSGGMATVWRARDTRLERSVAIKRPKPGGKGSVDAARFEREARAAATVAHPNVVAVHDAGVDDAGPFLVMELVDGPSLATADAPAGQVARIGAEVASALAALHAAGLVHGDVKPANILLAADGAKLTDFGIARAADDTVTISSPAVMFGTPAYAAPETLAHGVRTTAADVYSLAAVLYELLTGSRWDATPGSTRAMPPAAWAGVLEPALSPDPTHRPTAAELAASLASLARGGADAPTTALLPVHPRSEVAPATRSSPDSSGWQIAVAAFAIGSVVLVALAVLLARDGANVSGGEAQPSVTIPGLVIDTTLAPATVPATDPAAPPPTTPVTVATTPPTTPPTTPTTPVAPGLATGVANDVAAELIALIDSVNPKQLKPKDADRIVERIDEVMRVAAERPHETEAKLGEAAKQIDKHLRDESARERAEDLLRQLAEALGVPAETVTGRPGR
jgi:hypothetical protein